jgi:hypothetical protein
MVATDAQLSNPSWVTAAYNAVAATWRRIQDAHSMNNGRLIALDAQANRILDPTERAKAKARIQASVKRQVAITGAMRALVSRINSVRSGIVNALRSIGVDASGLAGLGVVPFLPIAVGVAIVAAGAVAASIYGATQVQSRAVDNDAKMVAQYAAGKLSFPDLMKFMDENRARADKDTSALGLASTLEAALPLALIVGAVVLGPRLLDMVNGRRRAAA